MNDIHILVTMPQHAVFSFFDADAMAALEHIGTVHWNTLGRQYTQDELGAAVRGMDICVTGWGTPVFDEAVLAQAGRLRLIAHTGGSVKPYVTDAVYGRGIRVVSGNEVFASPSPSVVAYALASLRQIPYHSVNLAGGIWPESFANRGLSRQRGHCGLRHDRPLCGGHAGAVPLSQGVFPAHRPGRAGPLPHGKSRAGGTVRHLRHHFHPQRHDAGKPPSCHAGAAAEHEARRAACQYGAGRSHRRAGAVRGAGRTAGQLSAALDVYETEPLPAGHPLEKLPNVLLMPHMEAPRWTAVWPSPAA